MATTIGKLNFLVAADSSGVRTGLLPGMAAIQGLQSTVGGMVGQLSMLFGGMSAAGAGGWAVKLASDAEQAHVAFEVLLGSGEKATAMLGQLRTMAASTPLQLTELRDAAQLMLNFGVAQEAILPALGMLGDVSGGNAEKLNRLALAFGQSASAGRLMGQDLLQMINAGFNPLQEISKRTGESMADLKKRMEEGGVSSQEVVTAFQDATSEGGRFFGMMDKQSETLAGRFSTLKDNVALLFTEIGERLLPAMKMLTETGINTLDWIKNLDMGTVRTAANIAAMATGFTAVVTLVPKLVAAGATIVKTLRSIALAGSIAQSLTGPQGIALVAAGLAAAAISAVTINKMFDDASAAASKATVKVKETRKEIASLFNSNAGAFDASPLKEQLKSIGDQIKEVDTRYKKLIDNLTARRGVFTGAAERFAVGTTETLAKAGQEGLIQKELVRLREAMAAELKLLREQEKAVENAIKEKKPIQVTERRI